MATSKVRLDIALTTRGLTRSRSQAESYIKLGDVKVNDQVTTKSGVLVSPDDRIELTTAKQYVSRAALKLASVVELFRLDFHNKIVLDVGSSTGGFTDYALQHNAKKVIAVEVGTNQLHESLHDHPQIELHEKTDIRDIKQLNSPPDIVVADVSFISLRQILPHVVTLCTSKTQLVVMVKPQFEASKSSHKHKGVIKNEAMRRNILKDFETWAKQQFVIKDKADSAVSGAKGNRERFYLMRKA
jgi:23S rRNA (cytidine1920-2'-O)/16S rRNA (cytidine1409-2'-O)-methyltransferase